MPTSRPTSSKGKAAINPANKQPADAASQKQRLSFLKRLTSYIARPSKPKRAKSLSALGSSPKKLPPEQPSVSTHEHPNSPAQPPAVLPTSLERPRILDTYYSFPPFQDSRRHSLLISLCPPTVSRSPTPKHSSSALTNKVSHSSLASSSSRKSRRISETPPICPGPFTSDDRPTTPQAGPFAEIQSVPHSLPRPRSAGSNYGATVFYNYPIYRAYTPPSSLSRPVSSSSSAHFPFHREEQRPTTSFGETSSNYFLRCRTSSLSPVRPTTSGSHTSSSSSRTVRRPPTPPTLRLRGGGGDGEKRRVPGLLWFYAGGRGGPPSIKRFKEMHKHEREARESGSLGMLLGGGRTSAEKKNAGKREPEKKEGGNNEGAGEPAAEPAPEPEA